MFRWIERSIFFVLIVINTMLVFHTAPANVDVSPKESALVFIIVWMVVFFGVQVFPKNLESMNTFFYPKRVKLWLRKKPGMIVRGIGWLGILISMAYFLTK
jgi:hypothetical protein